MRLLSEANLKSVSFAIIDAEISTPVVGNISDKWRSVGAGI